MDHFENVRGTYLAHLILGVVQLCNFPVHALPGLTDKGHICHAILVTAHIAEAADDGCDLLIAEDAPRPAAAGLLDAGLPATDVIPGGVDRGIADVVGRLPGAKHCDAALASLIAAIFCGQHAPGE